MTLSQMNLASLTFTSAALLIFMTLRVTRTAEPLLKSQEKKPNVDANLLGHLSQNRMSSLVLHNVPVLVRNPPEVPNIVQRWQVNRIYHEPCV